MSELVSSNLCVGERGGGESRTEVIVEIVVGIIRMAGSLHNKLLEFSASLQQARKVSSAFLKLLLYSVYSFKNGAY